MNLIVIKNSSRSINVTSVDKIIEFGTLKSWFKSYHFLKHIYRYDNVELRTSFITGINQPLLIAVAMRLISKGSCVFVGDNGEHEPIRIRVFIRLFCAWLKELFQKEFMLKRVEKKLIEFEQYACGRSIFDLNKRPVYLRTNMWFGVQSGGSVAHTAGVINSLDKFFNKPIFVTTDNVPTVREDVELCLVRPIQNFWNHKDLPTLSYNEFFYKNIENIINRDSVSFVYHRYSINNYTGILLAEKCHVPFVLEYNGSEIWMAKNWGNKLRYENLTHRIEILNLNYARVVVVVSQAMKDELLVRGIESEKILVNPNGVDLTQYHPNVTSGIVRQKYSLNDMIVVGFIGTFGLWHGVDRLVSSMGELFLQYPDYRKYVSLLLIGDGESKNEIQKIIIKYDLQNNCILTGLIPQKSGPQYLAACDILVAPHVKNPDNTPFFGSPTKLFEYMAMGKGIVASSLDQMGTILTHDHTAYLVEPGSIQDLMLGIKNLIDDRALRSRLGLQARKEVVENYTWDIHVSRIFEKIKQCCTADR